MTCLTVQFYTAPSPFLVSSSSAQEDQISSSASCSHKPSVCVPHIGTSLTFNPLNPELNPICYLLALLAHHFLHVSRIMVKLLTLRLLMSHIYIYIYMERIFLMFLDNTHNDAAQSVGLLWTSDQLVAETST